MITGGNLSTVREFYEDPLCDDAGVMPLFLSENFDEFVGFQNLSDENSYAKVISPRAAAYFIDRKI